MHSYSGLYAFLISPSNCNCYSVYHVCYIQLDNLKLTFRVINTANGMNSSSQWNNILKPSRDSTEISFFFITNWKWLSSAIVLYWSRNKDEIPIVQMNWFKLEKNLWIPEEWGATDLWRKITYSYNNVVIWFGYVL